jgi:hypothetical protein
MDEMELKALAYACECAGRAPRHYSQMGDDSPLKASITAHARDIMQSAAFRREVSDAVKMFFASGGLPEDALAFFHDFIIDKPVDPFVALTAENARLRAVVERLEAAQHRGPVVTYKRGFGPGDGDGAALAQETQP